MSPTQQGLLLATIAYFVGSVPFGWLTARVVAGIDIRQHGSGNIGATNVARVIGGKWGTVVLVLDALKGLLPVLLLPPIFFEAGSPQLVHAKVACAIAAMAGHMFPCWLKFRGGKGVATALGVVLVLAPIASLVAAGVFAATFVVFRFVSLASILAALAFAIFQLVQPGSFSRAHWSLTLFSLVAPALIIIRHRSNIVRLLRGQEPKFQFGKRKASVDARSTESAKPAESSGGPGSSATGAAKP